MYSVNQVNQFYVVGASVLPTGTATTSSPTNVKDLALNYTVDGDALYFKYKGAGGVVATDRIKKGKVKWVSFTAAAQMQRAHKTCTIAPAASTTPIAGKEYIITFNFRSYFGMSDEDIYIKNAAVRAKDNTWSSVLKGLAVSLAKNMSREIDWPFDIAVAPSSGSATSVTATTKEADLTGTVAKIILTEKEQPWELGRMKSTQPDYSVSFVPSTVTISSAAVNDYTWATATFGTVASDPNPITNGRDIADLEWFFKGERADQYRGKDWPLSISTPASLFANPTASYDVVVIHFWDDIDNEGPQKSERDMTFVSVAAAGANALSAKMQALAKTVAAFVGLDTYIVNGVGTTTATESAGSGT